MLLTNTSTPASLIVAIWSLRSVPISMLILMFVFNSGSIVTPQPNRHFWFDAIAIVGIVGIVMYWNKLKRLHWNVGFTIYAYIFLILLLRNPYGILTAAPQGQLVADDWQSIFNSLGVGAGIFGIGILLEVLISQLRQLKIWAWWVALLVSILYVSSIVFFFSGTLGIWSLLDIDTKRRFKRRIGS
ncbi:hypothetical protein [Chamaesiphon sp. OTE_75_metabat_556]|jgi:hypothetical protein|uniref:hypothetical protein n=1 Tax=Chamaesiphon sp. OTE_75_metabat_556 TaxID=2964692 RepID=UPI00286ABFB3|nr:hypothetical protein [Chamaesiphon sp. OTE_75_metabat_556]